MKTMLKTAAFIIIGSLISSILTVKVLERQRQALEDSADMLAKTSYIYGCIDGLNTMGMEDVSPTCVSLADLRKETLKVQLKYDKIIK